MKRPTSVTVIGIISTVSAVFGTLSLFLFLIPDIQQKALKVVKVSSEVLFAKNVLTFTVSLMIGIGLLKGKTWAKKLFIYSYPLLLIISYLTMIEITFMWYLGILYYSICFYFLNKKHVDVFFQNPTTFNDTISEKIKPNIEDISKTRKVLSIIFLIIGGYFLVMVSIVGSVAVLEVEPKIFIVAIFTTTALIFGGAGVFLWGKNQWRKSTGTVLISSGSLAIFVGTTMYLFIRSVYGNELPKETLETFNLDVMISSVLYGLTFFGIGLFLFLNQRKKDHAFNQGAG